MARVCHRYVCPTCGRQMYAVEEHSAAASTQVEPTPFRCLACRDQAPTPRYTVGLFDEAGAFDEFETDALPVAVKVRDDWERRYPRKVALLCDGERDGRCLTDDEIEEALHGRDDDDAP